MNEYISRFKDTYLLPEVAAKAGNLIGYAIGATSERAVQETAQLAAGMGWLPYLGGLAVSGIKKGLKEKTVKKKITSSAYNTSRSLFTTTAVGASIDFIYRSKITSEFLEFAIKASSESSELEKLVAAATATLAANILSDIPYYSVVLPIDKAIDKTTAALKDYVKTA